MKKFSKSGLSAALLAALTWLPLQAHAGLFDDDEARRALLDLRTKVEAMRAELNTRLDTKSDKSSTLDLVSQNEMTLQEVAKLRGQIEVLANELANTQKRQKDFYVDLDNRLRKLEPREVVIDGKSSQVDPAEQKNYEAAMLIFKSGDYKAAGNAFTDFVARFPNSSYAASAQYYLGSSYYAQRDCKSAINAQLLVLKNYQDSPKAPDAMLNIASCQIELKDKAAKKTLQDLIKNYPDSPAAAAAKDRLNGK
ncbi:tol-pal system protein YbgF [Pseudoduganella danionis]|uniref:Cell division coordinator CpoB n=1 Tax=Pseudoduganella danionis TaxID=1890295 RepID=A0ABW9SWG7_9BURK|nr:tol-pal system protein YbgF [Pseudoduganella danionis]MTW35187.1 tol-pal system protein YbgF [Pseudoduganella danionis]